MKLTNFYTPNSSSVFKLKEFTIEEQKKVLETKSGDTSLNDSDIPYGIFDCAKQNASYSKLISILKIGDMDNHKIYENFHKTYGD